jgi:hypothetical protein
VHEGEVLPEGTVSLPATATTAPIALGFDEVAPAEGWETIEPDVYQLKLDWSAAEGAREVVFPWDGVSVDTIPAMSLSLVSFAPPPRDRFSLPLPLGLVRLETDRWLVADTTTVHLAPLFSGSGATVSVRDETDPWTPQTWRFLLVEGDGARATEIALATNNLPPTTLACPPVAAIP